MTNFLLGGMIGFIGGALIVGFSMICLIHDDVDTAKNVVDKMFK